MSSNWEDIGVAVASMVLATFSMLDKPENVFLITFTGAPCFPISAIASPNSPTVEANFCRIPATLSTLDDGIFNAATGGSTVPLPNDPALFSSLTPFLASSALHPTMLVYFDRVQFKGMRVNRTYPTIVGWSAELARKRVKEENKAGSFGRGTVLPRISKPTDIAAATSRQNDQPPVAALNIPSSSVDKVAGILQKLASTV
nr:uncharacterized protein LOC109158392 [Ipomoea trifida]